MAEYSSDESLSSDSSDDEHIEATLKKIPKAPVPETKQKRVYVRKAPIDEAKQKVISDKLIKAREAKAVKAAEKKQLAAQEKAELAELKSLKDKGKLKIKKDPPAEPKVKAKKTAKVVEVHHHHYGDDEDAPKKPRAKRVPREPPVPRLLVPPPVIPKMLFA